MYFNNERNGVVDQPVADAPDNNNPNQAAAGNGEFREGGRVVIQPYIRPKRFTPRVNVPKDARVTPANSPSFNIMVFFFQVALLIVLMCISMAVSSFLFLTFPGS